MLKMYLNTKYFCKMYLNTKYIDVFKYFCKYFFILFSKYPFFEKAYMRPADQGGDGQEAKDEGEKTSCQTGQLARCFLRSFCCSLFSWKLRNKKYIETYCQYFLSCHGNVS